MLRRGSFLLLFVAACGAPRGANDVPRGASVDRERPPHHGHGPAVASSPGDAMEAKLAEVARIHGAPGPWAVAGYRMGEYALHHLGLPKGSFDLEIVHHTPREVRYSCIADGAAAATGASLGKLNLSLVDAPAPDTHTVYRRRSTGKAITLRIVEGFATRFADVPRTRAHAAGREVLELHDEEIFEAVP